MRLLIIRLFRLVFFGTRRTSFIRRLAAVGLAGMFGVSLMFLVGQRAAVRQPAGAQLSPTGGTARPSASNRVRAIQKKKTYRILYWNGLYNALDYNAGYGRKPFLGCEFSNCWTSANKNLLSRADAVIFHVRTPWIPVGRRDPSQRFVFFLVESPVNTFQNLTRLDGFFNITMTYRTDSDVPVPYFSTVASPERTPLPDILRRTLPVVWVSSHCRTISGRENYVVELKKYIDVRIFGKCGENSCVSGDKHRSLRCPMEAAKTFHFFLAFENSRCHDYISEKTYLALKYGIVPVVMGPDRATYERRAPPNSFIHVDDFEGPQELAEHLRYLMSNSTAYAQHFEWRRHYSVLYGQRWCQLCRYLNEEHPPKWYTDIHQWWCPFCKSDLNCQHGPNV